MAVTGAADEAPPVQRKDTALLPRMAAAPGPLDAAVLSVLAVCPYTQPADEFLRAADRVEAERARTPRASLAAATCDRLAAAVAGPREAAVYAAHACYCVVTAADNGTGGGGCAPLPRQAWEHPTLFDAMLRAAAGADSQLAIGAGPAVGGILKQVLAGGARGRRAAAGWGGVQDGGAADRLAERVAEERRRPRHGGAGDAAGGDCGCPWEDHRCAGIVTD